MSDFIILTYPWFMPLLFLLAGVSTKYSLIKRSIVEYIKERFSKLLIPFFAGVCLVVPFQTYIAEKFYNDFRGNYFDVYKIFFSGHPAGIGDTGGFTPAHLWFLLYLFLISLIAVPVIFWLKKINYKFGLTKLPVFVVLLFSIVTYWSSSYCNLIPDKSILEYFVLFMLGYLIFFDDDFQDRLEKRRFVLAVITLAGTFCILAKNMLPLTSEGVSFLIRFTGLAGICALMGLGKKYYNFVNPVSRYFAQMSFPIYIFHQSVLLGVGYQVLKYPMPDYLQALIIIVLSFPLTILICEIVKRIPVIKTIFGMK